MYINYEEIFEKISKYMPDFLKKEIKNIGNELKINQNLRYIKKNRKKVIQNLKEKYKRGEKLNVAFYIYDETKWKTQSVYDLMEKSEHFTPHIFVSKINAPKNNYNHKDKSALIPVYNFFKNKNMRVQYAYDFEKDFWIPFEDMNPRPDIIYYCHPWYIYKTQGPVMASKYALTCYSEYSVPASLHPQEYYLRFHRYIGTQYVLNDIIKNYFSANMKNRGKNLKVAGHPILDYFYLNKDTEFEDKKYIIYAPHWSVGNNNVLRWGTFLETGEFILEYAKKHPEQNWLFKPHPCLKGYLLAENIWSEEKIEKYWSEWEKIGTIYESGDYLKLFMESEAMLTDCGSFKSEYFMTQKPQFFLKSNRNPVGFNPNVEKINKTSYEASTKEELEFILNEVLVKKNDFKKDLRKKLYNECGYKDMYCAKNIVDDIIKTLEEE